MIYMICASVGAVFGAVVMGLMAAAGRADEREERMQDDSSL